MAEGAEQLSMFDTSGMATRPGQKSFDQWLNTESPVHHGTFRSDFGDAPAAHFGTIGQASFRLDAARSSIKGSELNRARYFDPSATEDSVYDDPDFGDPDREPESFTGKVYARRATQAPMQGRLRDADANAAEAGFLMNKGYEDWEVPSSVSESAGSMMPTWEPSSGGADEKAEPEFYSQRSRAGARALGQGRPIRYRTDIEGGNPMDSEMGIGRTESRTSMILPREAQASWESDVASDPGTQTWVQDWANKRIQSGQASAVPFPSPTIPRDAHQQMNFYDNYDPGAPEPNPPPFPRDLALQQRINQQRKRQRPILNQMEFRA